MSSCLCLVKAWKKEEVYRNQASRINDSQTSLAKSQPAPWQSEQSLRPALTIKKGSLGIARPEALQRLQLRTGSLTRTSPLPRHTGHAPSSNGLPAQNPQVFGEYADIQASRESREKFTKGSMMEALCKEQKRTLKAQERQRRTPA